MSRRPVLPFVTEFKNRSSKSSAPRPSRGGGATGDELKPSFLDTGKFFEDRSQNDGGREVAKRAADAIFRFDGPEAPVAEAPSPQAPTGRVLPSLIDADDELTVRLREADGTRHRSRKVKKAAPSSKTPSQRPNRKPRSEPAPPLVEPLATRIDSEQQIARAGRPQRRSIQKRWVLKTELKPGERWKRRLHKAAR